MIWLLLFSIIAGVLGRMGGYGKPFRTWVRDWLIPLFFIFSFMVINPNPTPITLKAILVYLITYGLLGASLTTYWDSVFGWDNLWFAGFVSGISAFPLIFLQVPFIIILLRSLLLGAFWGVLNQFLPNKVILWEKATAEEFLRYFLLVFSVWFLL